MVNNSRVSNIITH